MRALLGANLVVVHPGPLRTPLQAAATVKRRGRLPRGERRVVRFWRYSQAKDTLWLPRGLHVRLRELAPGLLVEDRRLRLEPVRFGWRGNLYDYQYLAVAKLAAQGGGVLVSPPGSGKTQMGLALVAEFRQPALWLVHTKDLARQAVERARELFNLPRRAVGYVGEGDEEPGTHLTVAMVQTLAKRPETARWLAERIGTVVADECQHIPALTVARVVSVFPAYYRVGLTATPTRTDGLHPIIYALMGPGSVRITPEQLVRRGRLVVPTVRVIDTGFRFYGEGDWNVLQKTRAADSRRNWLICTLAAKEAKNGHRVIVLVELVRHARLVESLLRERWRVPAWAVVGEVAPAVRRRVYQRVSEGGAVLVATKLADEGLDLPALDRLILGASGRSAPRVEQQIGRVMRAWQGKEDAVVYDLADLDVPALRDQARERLRVYRRLGFNVERQRLAVAS